MKTEKKTSVLDLFGKQLNICKQLSLIANHVMERPSNDS